jgi:hypothetical protein
MPAIAATPDLDTLIEQQRGQIMRKDYTLLGLLSQIMLEPSTPALPDPSDLKRIQSTILDWYNLRVTQVMVGLGKSGDILIVSPLLQPPPIPDPNWRHSGKTELTGALAYEVAPTIEQKLEDRASGILETKDGESWYVIQPVQQIMFRPKDHPGWGIVSCFADSEGKHTALLYNPRLGLNNAHFVFGRTAIQIH